MANSYELLLKIGGQLESSFGKSINGATKSLSGIGKTASTLKNVVVGALGAAGVGLSLKGLIDAGSGAEQTAAQMNAVLKSTHGVAGMTAKQLDTLAEAQQGITKYGNDATEQAENMLLTFTNVKSNVFPQTIQAAEDMATAMKTDATSAAMTLGKALNDPAAGLSRLTKQGVTFSDAQKKQIQAMEKAGNVAGAQKVMIQEIEKEFGGSAKAAGQTVSGQMAIIKNTLHSTMAQAGLMILPTIRSLLPQVTGLIKQAAANFQAHQEDIKRGLAQFAAAASTVFTKVIPAISSAVSKLTPIISSAVKSAFPMIKEVFNFISGHKDMVIAAIVGIGSAMATFKTASKVGGIFTHVGKAVKDAKKIQVEVGGIKKGLTGLKLHGKIFENLFHFPPQVLLIIAAITVIAALAFLIIKNWGPISAWFKNLWSGVINVFHSAMAGIGKVLNGIGAFFKQWGPLILAFIAPVIGIPLLIVQHWNTIGPMLQNVWNKIKSVVTAAVSPIIKSVMGPFNQLKTGISNILNGLKNIFQGAWTVIKNIVMAPVLLICDIISGKFGKIPGDMSRIWSNVKNGIKQVWDGIKQYFTGVLQAMLGLFGVIWNGILSIGNSIGSALASFFTNLWNGIKNTAVNVWNSLLSFFQSLPSKFIGFMTGIGNAIIHGFDSAVNFIKNLPAQMLQWGKDMINGLIKGITGAIGGIQKAAGNVANTIRSFLHFSVPDTGPLKDAASYGPDFVKLYSGSITKNIPSLKKAAQAAAGSVNSGVSKTPVTKIPSPSGAGGNGGAQGNVIFNINYAPEYNAQGNTSKEEIQQAGDYNLRKFDECMKKWRSEMRRRTGKDPIPV